MTTTSSNLPSLYITPSRLFKTGNSGVFSQFKCEIPVRVESGKKTYTLHTLKSLGKEKDYSFFNSDYFLPIFGQIEAIKHLCERALYTSCNFKKYGTWLIRRDHAKSLSEKLGVENLKTVDLDSLAVRKAVAKYLKTNQLTEYKPHTPEYNMKLSTNWASTAAKIREGKRFCDDGKNRLLISSKNKRVEFSCSTSPSAVLPVVQAYFNAIRSKKEFSEISKLLKCMQAHSVYTEAGIHCVHIRESAVKNGVTSNPKTKTVNVSISDGHLCDNEIKLPK